MKRNALWRSMCFGVIALCLVGEIATEALGAKVVNESARQIPVAHQVDVVVVGGSTGAVAAAVEAAEQGASVFLAAPYPYLGEDMTATLRLWLEEGEEPTAPLADCLFNDPLQIDENVDPNRHAFSYETTIPSDAKHRDTTPASMLSDGRFLDAPSESVQYNDDVGITADLRETRAIDKIRVRSFRRAGGDYEDDFDVARINISLSDDKKTWRNVATIENNASSGDRVTLTAEIGETARYAKLDVVKPKHVGRLLLGEIEIIAPKPDEAEAKSAPRRMPRPMHIKKTLDESLLAAGVKFLYSCYATDVLHDASGELCGIVMANRAGRQAVVAKVIIDATDRAVVAQAAGATFRPFVPGEHTFQWVVVGGEVQTADGMTARTIEPPFRGPYPNRANTSSGTFPVIEYTIKLPMADASYASRAKAEQQARSLAFHEEQQFTSDQLFQIPRDTLIGRRSAGHDDDLMGGYQPAEIESLYVLGPRADLDEAVARRVLRPPTFMAMGRKVGHLAALKARARSTPKGIHVFGRKSTDDAAIDVEVGEMLAGTRPVDDLPTIPQPERTLPVLAEYDVVVIGGGTAGAPAGIAAARKGAKTLIVEYLHGLGGVGTQGAISKYYWGNRVGFSATVAGSGSWVIEQKMEWWRQQVLQSGADIWFGTIGCGAVVDQERVVGAVVATPEGRGVVLAKVVIDATGNADVAAAAGAETIYTDETEFGMQGTGLPGRKLGETYTNTDFTLTDETDMVDLWQMFVHAKNKYPDAFDQGKLIDTRERRRIVGDYTVTILDQMNERTYPDSVVRAYSNFDTHGYTVDPYLLLEHPEKKGFFPYVPYRCMLPKGIEGMLVVGLGVSAHRDAVPMIRMQPDIQNGGYAAGTAAAMAAEAETVPRAIDVRQLQLHLVEVKNLPDSVLTDTDSYPLSDERIAEAVRRIGDGKSGAAVVLTHPERAMPMLEKALAEAAGESKLAYARCLAVMGNSSGLDALMSTVMAQAKWDKGWNYQGMGQFGSAMSPLDNLLVAIGRTRERRAAPVVIEKLKQLSAEDDFSHHRAAGLALELIGDSRAAVPLAELLAKPGMAGHVHDSVDKAIYRETPGGTNAVTTRRDSLRELLIARALYRCGDHGGIGQKTLRAYTKDLRGHLSRHAKAVLDDSEKPSNR